MSAILGLPGEIGALLLKFATAKYIESAGAGQMTQRAAVIKAVATEIEGVTSGAITVGQLATTTAAVIQSKGIPMSSQILLQGLSGLVTTALPTANSGLLEAALAADAKLFLDDVIQVASSFGA